MSTILRVLVLVAKLLRMKLSRDLEVRTRLYRVQNLLAQAAWAVYTAPEAPYGPG